PSAYWLSIVVETAARSGPAPGLSRFEGGANVLKRHHKSHRFGGTRIESQCDIEFSRIIGDSVHHDPPNPDGVGRLSGAIRRIAKHRASQATSLLTPIN